MVRLREQHDQAVEFRKRGFTYSEIAKITGVSVSTVSNWLSAKAFSKRVKEDNALRAGRENSKRMRLLNKARSNQYKRLYAEAERTAELEYRHFRDSPLFVAGVMLYISEGDNASNRLIRIANARKDVHRIFIRFATEYLGVPLENVRFWLLLYPDLNESECKKAWKKALKIPFDQFYKTQVVDGRSKKRTLHHGVGNTIIGSTVLKRKLMRWIELASKEF